MLNYIQPKFFVDDSVLKEIKEALESGIVTNNGPYLRQFENNIAKYFGIKKTVAVASGSDALLLSLNAMNLRPGKIILPAYTYIATVNSIIHAGFEPIFCDIKKDDFTVDPQKLKLLLTNHPDIRCIIPVNVFGIAPQLKKICELSRQSGIKVLYDNCHGFGTIENDELINLSPDVQTFSLHATKLLPAVEGGLIISNDQQFLERVSHLRNHGLSGELNNTLSGFNSKLDEIRAIIGLNSLKHIDAILKNRRKYGNLIRGFLEKHPSFYQNQLHPDGMQSNFQNLGVLIKINQETKLTDIIDSFASFGIQVRRYFDPPLYKFKAFDSAELEVTEWVYNRLLCFPIYSSMTDAQISKIEISIDAVAKKHGKLI